MLDNQYFIVLYFINHQVTRYFPNQKQYTMKKKLNLLWILFYLEDDNHEEVSFNGETLTSTPQMTEIWTIKWAFKNLKLIVFALVKNITEVQKSLFLR